MIAWNNCNTKLILFEDDAFKASEVVQWIEFSYFIEKYCNAMIDIEEIKSIANSDITPIKCAAKQELMENLEFVENHFSTRTFLVGDRLSLADIYLCCMLLTPMSNVFDSKIRSSKLKNTTRWFKTILSQAKLEDVLQESFIFFDADSSAAAKQNSSAVDLMDATHTNEVYDIANDPKIVKTSINTLFRRGRMRIKDLIYSPSKGAEFIGKQVKICGWVRTIRSGNKGKLAFVELGDGSCCENVQIVAEHGETHGFDDLLSAGGTDSSHCILGKVVESPAAGQVIEIKATKVQVLGTVDQNSYPLKKTGKGSKSHSVEFLREKAHLRARTRLIGAVARVRNACAQAVHQFFCEREFLYVHTPIITGADCEGAGEMFQVTTLLSQAEKENNKLPLINAEEAATRANESNPPNSGDIDYRRDFFGGPTYLTVSGQLNVETYACALSDVYTFGPTFRAENSHTSRHLAEFWMIEPEICFATLKDVMDLAEDFLKYIAQYVLDHCPGDIKFFDDRVENGLEARLCNVIDNPFKRLTYTEAIELLNMPEHLAAGSFEEHPTWGIDLGSEHERYLAEKVYKKPVILTDYPADIKAFYMKQNDLDDKQRLTVQAMDILVPRIGEIIGGSAREENQNKLQQRIEAMGMLIDDFDWYLDLRRYGTVPHGGFGMGFERLVMFVSGVSNIRDVIPFPRFPNNCAF